MPARRTAKTATIDPNSVNIANFCQSQGINEQIFRLELMQYQDNADSTKTVDAELAKSVATSITSTSKALPQTTEKAENITQQAIQPAQGTATEQPQKPQNSDIVASTPSVPTSQPQQSANGSTAITSLDELVATVKEDVQLADLILQFRNQQITQNKQSRDAQLVQQLQESRIDTRNQVFDALRGFGSAVASPDLPDLEPDLASEVDRLSLELGKGLTISS
ncbi:hypothetical protein [Richelia sinica]|uniref:hypothetical protein n=1 Tax=Richelia sinica TaxID=1357545 RepID=UPI00168202BF|nr:hypothetical protein [Richelia sinica]MBD2667310.1 hypothetical protein [Richelia sinica FACHB-800]